MGSLFYLEVDFFFLVFYSLWLCPETCLGVLEYAEMCGMEAEVMMVAEKSVMMYIER